MIRHVVMWKMAAADEQQRAADAAEVAVKLRGLTEQIPEIVHLSSGAEALYPSTNYDVVLVADFAGPDELERYKQHPAHLEVAAFIGSVQTERAAVDFEV